MKIALHWQILIGLVAGVLVGILLNLTADPLWEAAGVQAEAYPAGEEPRPELVEDPDVDEAV